jgi:hypothetical protein
VTTGGNELERELELLDERDVDCIDEDKLELRELELIDDEIEMELERELELIEDRELDDELTELLEPGVTGREHSLTPPAMRPPKVASEQVKVPLRVL